MFAPRVLAVLCFGLAVCAALPAQTSEKEPAIPRPIVTITEEDVDDTPWFSFPLFGNLFAPLWKLFPSFADIGPTIISDDNKFQVVVSVKDYKKDELKVKLRNHFMYVQGTHEGKQDDRDVFTSQFFHTYSLPENCSGSDVTAELSNDGYLVVTAPVTGPVDRTQSSDRDVPIKETGAPYQKPKDQSTVNPELSSSSSSTTVVAVTEPVPERKEESSDRKEPTTPPSEREEITEKDNSIPHGNEIGSL